MQEQPTHDPARKSDELERDVLYLLTSPNGMQPIWTVEEIGRTLDDQLDAIDAVGGLRRAGLVHRTSDGHVFASRAAVRLVQMIGQPI